MDRKPSLREDQKALTRKRLLDAARDVFYSYGYRVATVDQIVAVIGASRQTFYHYFAGKEAVLPILIDEYNSLGAEVMRQFPERPTAASAVKDWLLELSRFFEEQKAAFTVVSEVSASSETHAAYGKATVEVGEHTIDVWLKALADRSPAFAAALKTGNKGVWALARGRLLILQMIWTGSLAWEQKGSALARETLAVTADAIYDFVSDPRFASAPGA